MSQEPTAEKIKGEETEKFFTAPLIIIFVTVFIDLIGFGMVIPILPFYANTPPFNATPVEIGFLVSIYSWMQFFFSPVLGRLSDKYGRRPILFISLLGSAVGYFVIGLAGTLTLVFVGRIIGGITGGNISTAQAYIADVTSKENRAKGMGLFGAAFGLGFIFGPALAGVLSKYGVHVPFYCAAALSLVNAVALFFILPESLKPGAHAETAGRKNRFVELATSFADPRFSIINLVYFLLVTAFSIMTYAFVLYTAFRFGYNAEQNGYLFAFVGLISIVAQGVLFSIFVKRFGESKLIISGCALMAASLFAVPFVGPAYGGLVGLLVGIAALSLGNAFASPSLTSLTSKTAHEHEQGKSLGVMQSGASLARAVGPTIGGFLLNNRAGTMDNFTVYRTFWTAAGIMALALLMAVYFALTGENREL
jgi:DHA1 family tetracycline resistance protein-like MFS transporter